MDFKIWGIRCGGGGGGGVVEGGGGGGRVKEEGEKGEVGGHIVGI